MISRFAYALLFVVTGLMVAISPVAGLAVGDQECAAQIDPQSQHHHMGHDGSAAESVSSVDKNCSCCDQGCLFDPTIVGLAATNQTRVTRVLGSWSDVDFTDLADPNGLSRPPRV